MTQRERHYKDPKLNAAADELWSYRQKQFEIRRLKAKSEELRARHRVEVVERALVIMAERVLEYAQKAKVTAMTSDGLFSCDKDAQLALLVNDALREAEQKMTEEDKK